ncbi:MAG: prepilin-type N-terminal cleavage/methylation domain-containing protein [Fidelibacterota bacterium]
MIVLPKINSKGFTLVELIIGVIVYGIISTVVAVVISNSLRMYSDVRSRKNLNIDGQYSVFLFTRDYSHLSQETGLLFADNNKIRFKTNQGFTVEYALDSTLFTRKIISDGISNTLTDHVYVSASGFQYYERDHTELTSVPLSITEIQNVWTVELLINMANDTDTISYIADVYPENYKLATEGCTGN